MITGKYTLSRLKRKIDTAAKQAAYANVVALTKTAWSVKREEEKAIERYLHNPTPFTKRAYLVKRATKARPYSQVYAKPIQEKYLSPQVWGGVVGKRVPVPPSSAKNKYGNLPRTATKRKRAYSVHANGKDYTFVRTGKRTTKLLGTWNDKRSYKARLPFHRIGQVSAKAVYGGHLKQAYRKAMMTAR